MQARRSQADRLDVLRTYLRTHWAASAAGVDLADRVANGRLVRRSPVSDLLEVEVLRSAVVAKRAAWEALETLADDDRRPASPALAALPRLRERADSQVHRLSLAHGALSRRVLGAPNPLESSSCSNGVSRSTGADHDDSPADAGEELLDDRNG